jgi:membrane-associated phospholipid phosphatase
MGIACKKKKLSIGKTAYVHVLVSIALADAFIACWDEKYRSDRVRPETAIQKLINPRWLPLLQTPPFPEYVSGHSVASTAAAVTLTKIFGDNFSYTDDSEVEFGLPVRKYKSFLAASSEAAISRLYGGIHFRDAIDEGIWQGRKVGELVITKLNGYFDSIANKMNK